MVNIRDLPWPNGLGSIFLRSLRNAGEIVTVLIGMGDAQWRKVPVESNSFLRHLRFRAVRRWPRIPKSRIVETNGDLQVRKVHTMKLVAPWFEESWIGAKPFEIRSDDREGGYNVGDILHMREFRPDVGLYTGREIIGEVTVVVRDERFLQPGYVAMGVRIIEKKGCLR